MFHHKNESSLDNRLYFPQLPASLWEPGGQTDRDWVWSRFINTGLVGKQFTRKTQISNAFLAQVQELEVMRRGAKTHLEVRLYFSLSLEADEQKF